MGNLNKIFLIGRLGAKPEKRFTQNGTAVTTMNLATTEHYKDKSGQPKERTEWHRVVMWDRLADLADQYLDKGREVFIEGRLQTREWMDKDNIKRYTTEIIGTSMQFIGSAQGSGQSQQYGEYQKQQTPSAQNFGGFDGMKSQSPPAGQAPGAPPPPPAQGGQDMPFIEDDVPF